MSTHLNKLDGEQSAKFRDTMVYDIKTVMAQHLQVRNQAESRLLRLPSELLVHIARLVWPAGRNYIISLKPKDLFKGEIKQGKSEWKRAFFKVGDEYSHETALLYTCSRLRSELSSTFLSSNTFEIELLHHFSWKHDLLVDPQVISRDVRQWLTTFPNEAWRAVREIRIKPQDLHREAFWPPVAIEVAHLVERKLFGKLYEPPKVYIDADSSNVFIAERCFVSHKGEKGMMDGDGDMLSAEDCEGLYDCR